MTERYLYLFLGLIAAIALFQIWAVIEISRYTASAHKNKRKWTNIVLAVPVFGVIAYYAFGKRDFNRTEEED